MKVKNQQDKNEIKNACSLRTAPVYPSHRKVQSDPIQEAPLL